MAQSVSATINRAPFAGMPAYASPNPEGVAACHIDILGNATGGEISGGMVSSGQFLYRLELFNLTRRDATVDPINCFTIADWASDKFGFGAGSFSIDWLLEQVIGGGFSVNTFRDQDMRQIRRIPLGATRNVGVTNILFYDRVANTDTVVMDIFAMFTYWRKEALFLPGFLQSFYEAPFVPGGVQ